MTIGNIKIRTAKSLNNKLKINLRTDKEVNLIHYLNGIYDCRILGLCIYRIKNNQV